MGVHICCLSMSEALYKNIVFVNDYFGKLQMSEGSRNHMGRVYQDQRRLRTTLKHCPFCGEKISIEQNSQIAYRRIGEK